LVFGVFDKPPRFQGHEPAEVGATAASSEICFAAAVASTECTLAKSSGASVQFTDGSSGPTRKTPEAATNRWRLMIEKKALGAALAGGTESEGVLELNRPPARSRFRCLLEQDVVLRAGILT
jgi:hypothetical protein